MAIIPKLQISTLGPYSFLVTTSGAIQCGVPTIVVRFEFESEICAQNPKPAAQGHRSKPMTRLEHGLLTQFNIPPKAQQDVVALNIPMNNAMAMKML